MAKESSDDSFLETVNCSGFPLQIAVTRLVQDIRRSRGARGEEWRVLYTEHAWRDHERGTEGFLDLVLENEHGTAALVVECKRVREASWLFLSQEGSVGSRRHGKLWVTDTDAAFAGWRDMPLAPSSPECEFCVIHGPNSKGRQSIEQIASELVVATEALAAEEKPYHDGLRLYASLVVTTAKLRVASFDPAAISVSGGELADGEFVEVPYLRFRKQLSTRPRQVARMHTRPLADGWHRQRSTQCSSCMLAPSLHSCWTGRLTGGALLRPCVR